MKNKKHTNADILIFVISIIIIVCTISTINFHKGSLKSTTSNLYLPIISLEDFQEIVATTGEYEVLVYIGRDSCPTCNLIYPTLCDISQKHGLNIRYYSTEPDRDTRPDEMTAFLDTLGIKHVPTVVGIKNGSTTINIDGEKFVENYIDTIN